MHRALNPRRIDEWRGKPYRERVRDLARCSDHRRDRLLAACSTREQAVLLPGIFALLGWVLLKALLKAAFWIILCGIALGLILAIAVWTAKALGALGLVGVIG